MIIESNSDHSSKSHSIPRVESDHRVIIESNLSRGLSRGIRSISDSVSESESDFFTSQRASVHFSSSQSLFKHQPHSLNHSQMTDFSSSESLSENQSQSQSQSQSQIVSDQSARARALQLERNSDQIEACHKGIRVIISDHRVIISVIIE